MRGHLEETLRQNVYNYEKRFPGCIIEEDINYTDGDLGVPPVMMASKEACAQHSLTNDDALFWTFQKDTDNGNCWLRESTAGRTKNNRFVSGNRECGEGEQVLNTRITHHLAIVLLGVNDLEQHLQKRNCPQNYGLQAQKDQVSGNSTQLPLIDLFLNPRREDELRQLKKLVEEKEAESTYTEVGFTPFAFKSQSPV